MKLTKLLCVLSSVALLGGLGCKKDENQKGGGDTKGDTSAGKTTGGTDKPMPDKPEPPPAKKWTATDSLGVWNKCVAAFDSHKKEQLADCYDKDSKISMLDWIGPRMPGDGLDAITKNMMGYWEAFPDVKGIPQLVLVNGDKIAAISLDQGSNTGSMHGMPPTGKKVSAFSAGLLQVKASGKVATQSIVSDQTTWSHQMGMFKSPTAPAAETAWKETVTVVADPKDQAKIDTNVSLAKNLETATSSKDMDTLKAHIADDVTFRYAPMAEVTSGQAKYLEGMARWTGMFSSMNREIKDAWGAGDWVVLHVAHKGTIAVDLPGPDPKVKTKGKEVMTNQVIFYKFADQKINTHWVFENSYSFAVQAGLAEAPKMPDMSKMPKDKMGDKKMDAKKEDDKK